MAYYSVVSSFPVGDSESRSFSRRDAAADYAYRAIRAQYESQALLDRPCVHAALAKLPDDLRTIAAVRGDGRKILTIPCGDQRAVTINAGRGGTADLFKTAVSGLLAFNIPDDFRSLIKARGRNAAGTWLRFADGSRCVIDGADVRVTA